MRFKFQFISIWLALIITVAPVLANQNAKPILPNTPAGQRVTAYFQAFNAGDETAMRDFFTHQIAPAGLQKRSVDERLAIYREMRGEMGTLEIRQVLAARADAMRLLVQSKNGAHFDFNFEFEAEPPHQLIRLLIEDAAAPGEASAVDVPVHSETELVSVLEKYLAQRVAADEFAGVVLIARDSLPIFSRAYGLASQEYRVPNQMDTRFNLGSINKIFTKIAIGQLLTQGKLALTDRLGRILIDYPNPDAAQQVTVEHLLTMTSGIGDFFGANYNATPKDRIRTLQDYLPLFAGQPLAFEPGSQRQYSNGGYVVLGAIIEKVTGQSYYDYVRAQIFQPAGMHQTDWFEADMPTPNLASGYTREGMTARGEMARRNNIYTRPARGSSAGGGYATAPDLLKFSLALQRGKLRLPGTGENGPSAATAPRFDGIGVAGGAPGINAILEVDPTSGYTVIVLANYDPPAAEVVGKQIRQWLKGLPQNKSNQ